MEYKHQLERNATQVKPRLIIHGGAGNITPENLGPEKYKQYRHALLTIVSKADAYIRTPVPLSRNGSSELEFPSALDIATYAVTLLENNPLFNSGHGAVFTRDGINELEASVMVSRGYAKRGVGVTGLRKVKNPILLAKAMLEHGDKDLSRKSESVLAQPDVSTESDGLETVDLDVPSAQAHTLIHGETAETLAKIYGLELVDPKYFFTQHRWDEHIRALEKEKAGKGLATWSAEEYLPQGTCGAVALDTDGVICVATSTGGLTNKLTGRIGDTPVVGAGFWAEAWAETSEPGEENTSRSIARYLGLPGPVVDLSVNLRNLVADCLPTPFVYSPVPQMTPNASYGPLQTTRSIALSGTGNGDSFLRVAAARTVGSIARWAKVPATNALDRIAGRGGELQKSAGDRWGQTGEGEGGMIGIESIVSRDASGRVVSTSANILQDHNCGGMFRAWIDDDGKAVMRIFHPDRADESPSPTVIIGEGETEDVWRWIIDKV
ncbi:putative isoaspartyl peptidase/L-asparaginase [Daldinia childiae]|uniref:putative isoaspartyl peptidase/L-asparaginase n=1 Tax=Daldinia childiae TaxID=326645 RepID=UPI0014483CA0|nr:putative isoaspartyl peptidase/L-asparaginase [Daldinia childiae]KAF3055057.1 putative isoaspartyl peptidase/L-asparaginase [Daldinia childiae]